MLKRFRTMAVLEEAYAAASDERRVVDTENRVLNTNHAVVGYYTARSWRCRSTSARRSPTTTTRCRSGDESARDTQLKNLLAIPKMAEHICGTRILGNQPEDHEWNSIGALVLDYVGSPTTTSEPQGARFSSWASARAATDWPRRFLLRCRGQPDCCRHARTTRSRNHPPGHRPSKASASSA